MNEFVKIILEEDSNSKLADNSDYNKKKSEIYYWFKEKEETLSMIWQKTKEDAHKKFIRQRNLYDEEWITVKSKTNNAMIIKIHKEKIQKKLATIKEEYKETIQYGAEKYRKDYNELELLFEKKVNDLRESFLYSKEFFEESIDNVKEEYKEKEKQLEETFNKKQKKLNEKVSLYNQTVKKFKEQKNKFVSFVNKTKKSLSDKEKVIKEKEDFIRKREDKVLKLYTSLQETKKRVNEEYLKAKEEKEIATKDAIKVAEEHVKDKLKSLEEEKNKLQTFVKNLQYRQRLIDEEKEKKILREKDFEFDELGKAEDFFGLYGIEYDENTLKKEYRKKMMTFHPDKHSDATDYEKKELTNLFQETQNMFSYIKRSYNI